MTVHTVAIGKATSTGLYLRRGDGYQHVQPTRTPIVQPDVCEQCGGTVCDCITPEAQAALLARISADPHDYNNLTNLDIPF